MPGGHHILDEVRQVDLVPEPERGGVRLFVAQVRKGVEERGRIAERAGLQRHEPVHEPSGDVFDVGIDVDREVEQVADRDVVRRRWRSEDVQPLHDHDVGAADRHVRVGDDVVAHVRIERCVGFGSPRLHGAEKLHHRAAVVRLREAFASHQASAVELGVRVEESVGGDQFDARGGGPPAHQFAEESRDRGLAHRHGTCDRDDEGRRRVGLAEERIGRGTEPLGRAGVQREQPAERQIDLTNLGHVEAIAEPAQLDDLGFGERLLHTGCQARPVGAVDFTVERAGEGGRLGGINGHRHNSIEDYSEDVRLGVLDIGSNTVHLLVADVRPGGRPLAQTSQRTVLRLMRYLEPDGAISEEGVVALVAAVTDARRVAQEENVVEFLATATSAVREARNGEDVIARIEAALGQDLQVLGGESEARFTFLAVRRWFGWSAGQILLFDIGGGSLEIAAGGDELPDAAASVPSEPAG